MAATMAERMLDASLSQVKIFTLADFAYTRQSDQEAFNKTVLGTCKEAITEYRVIDLQPQWKALNTAVHQDTDTMPVSITADPFAARQVAADRPEIPFTSEPMIGIHGWYQTSDWQAYAVVPGESVDGSHITHMIQVSSLGDGGFAILVGGSIAILDGEWQASIKMEPYNTTLHPVFWGLTDEQRIAQMEVPATGGYSALGYAALYTREMLNILLANTIVQADPTVFRTAKTPGKLRKARERRGRPGARAKSWIDLPGLRYEKNHWTSSRRSGSGVAWHMVRGHWRHLTSGRFTVKQGTKVWVGQHFKGSHDVGVSRTPYKMDAPVP
jgi:hypothetical protein